MLPPFQAPPRRDTTAYRKFRTLMMQQRPLCEWCSREPSRVLAHKRQPSLGAALMDTSNVLALCIACDRLHTGSNPVLRRRITKR